MTRVIHADFYPPSYKLSYYTILIVLTVNNPKNDSYQPPQPHPDQLEQPKNPIRQPKSNSKAGSSKLSKTNLTCSTINNTTAHATQLGCPQTLSKLLFIE